MSSEHPVGSDSSSKEHESLIREASAKARESARDAVKEWLKKGLIWFTGVVTTPLIAFVLNHTTGWAQQTACSAASRIGYSCETDIIELPHAPSRISGIFNVDFGDYSVDVPAAVHNAIVCRAAEGRGRSNIIALEDFLNHYPECFGYRLSGKVLHVSAATGANSELERNGRGDLTCSCH